MVKTSGCKAERGDSLMKKTLSLILALLLVCSLAACGGGEGGNSAGGSIVSVVHPDFQLTGGFIEPVERQDKAPEGYIPISTAAEFTKIGLNPGGFYILMADIDLAGMEWEAISDFVGILDGNGYTVSNASDALFVNIEGGTVQNLGVNSQLVGKGAGIAYALKGGAQLFNCHFSGSITNNQDTVPGYSTVAGLVFSAKNAQILSCYNAADLYSTNICAGIVASIREAVTVQNCFNTGAVNVDTASSVCGDGFASGIVGQMHIGDSDGGASNITNCRNSGVISGVIAAGILGEAYIAEPVNLYISLCCNEGNIYAEASAYRPAFSGGILNVMNIEEGFITIADCYNTGDYVFAGIEGGECLQRAWDQRSEDLDHVRIERCFNTAWGFAGSITTYCKNLDCCYFLDAMPDIEETATGDGALFATVRQLSGDEMSKESSFEGFDFETVWQMGDDHPVFRQMGY